MPWAAGGSVKEQPYKTVTFRNFKITTGKQEMCKMSFKMKGENSWKLF